LGGEVLRITNWELRFENNRTRELKTMSWVPVECEVDSFGYTELADHRNGAAHYGVWIAMVKIAAGSPERGALIRVGEKGKVFPHTPATMARIARLPVKFFREAIPRLITIGWLTQDPETIQPNLFPQEGAGGSQEAAQKGTEQKGMEGKGKGARTPKPGSNIPPTPDEVTAYAAEIGFKLDGHQFCDYYAAQGWKLKSGRLMVNWQAAVRTWKRREEDRVDGHPPWEKDMQRGDRKETPEEREKRLTEVREHNERVQARIQGKQAP
jgi:hypothetical protein